MATLGGCLLFAALISCIYGHSRRIDRRRKIFGPKDIGRSTSFTIPDTGKRKWHRWKSALEVGRWASYRAGENGEVHVSQPQSIPIDVENGAQVPNEERWSSPSHLSSPSVNPNTDRQSRVSSITSHPILSPSPLPPERTFNTGALTLRPSITTPEPMHPAPIRPRSGSTYRHTRNLSIETSRLQSIYTDSIYPVSTLPSYPGTVRSASPPAYFDLSRTQSRRTVHLHTTPNYTESVFEPMPDLTQLEGWRRER